MQEISFSIPVSGTIRLNENSVTITVNRAETIISYEPEPKEERLPLPKGKTVFDVMLETARSFAENKQNRFSAADLYHEALKRYPGLRRNTWTSHMIASAPNHGSYKHYQSQRGYFRYLGEGTYSLKPEYLIKGQTAEHSSYEVGG